MDESRDPLEHLAAQGRSVERKLLEASWKFQLIAPALKADLSESDKGQYLRDQAGRRHQHPWRGAIRVSRRSLVRWCHRYLQDGLAGLMPRTRKDQGEVRRLPEGALERALQLRQEDSRRTVPQLIRLMEAEKPAWAGTIQRSTLDRHLRARGSRRIRRKQHQGPFHHFEAKAPNDLWQGDVLHGPQVLVAGKLVKCKVVSFEDDHARYFCHIEVYPDEQLPSVEDALKKAILKHGLPWRLFVDNGSCYTAAGFELACSELSIHLIHSTVGYAPSRGKQERAFGVLRDQFLNEVENLDPMPIEELNRYLMAWADRYHHTVHSGTEQTPVARYACRRPRLVTLDILERAFLQWDARQINKLGEIKFGGNVYRVDPTLARDRAVIRYDPYDLSRIYVWEKGHILATATPKELIHARRPGKPLPTHAKGSQAARRYLESLVEAHEQRLARELNLIEYRKPNNIEEE